MLKIKEGTEAIQKTTSPVAISLPSHSSPPIKTMVRPSRYEIKIKLIGKSKRYKQKLTKFFHMRLWCEIRESNSRLLLGKQAYYHYTNFAYHCF